MHRLTVRAGSPADGHTIGDLAGAARRRVGQLRRARRPARPDPARHPPAARRRCPGAGRDLDRAADLAASKAGGGAVAGPRATHPSAACEDAAMPGAGQPALGQVAIGQRSRHVAAPVGQDMHRAAVPDGDHGHLAEHFPHRLAFRQIGLAIRWCQPGSTRCGTGSAWLAPPARRNDRWPPARPLNATLRVRPAAAGGPAVAAGTSDEPYRLIARRRRPRAPRPPASAARAARTSPPRPPSPAGTAALRPEAVSVRPPGRRGRSSTLADSHAPTGAWTSTGCKGCPSQTPCSPSRNRPGPDQPGHALARGDGLVQAGIVLET